MDDDDQTPAREFLLAEFAALREQRNTLVTSAHNQVSVFFAAVTAVGVALGFAIGGANRFSPDYDWVAAVVLGILLLIGLGTLWRLTQYHGNSIRYAEGMNLIRGYFADQHPSIKMHLVLPVTENAPRFSAVSGNAISTTLVIIVLNAGLAGGLGYATAISAPWIDVSPRLLGILVSIVVTLMQFCIQFLVLQQQHLDYARVRDELRRD